MSSSDATKRVEEMAALAVEFREADAAFEAEQQREATTLHAMTIARDATLRDLNSGS